ncbi:MAG TPA: diadenylate cyclase CdaA [Bacteroidales bacterium]|nr:diadenylate cyclase CdaA [Bacteroidales bacterium]HNS47495.1 diadenylate cyclase CdaA [Bacteroidales bacterium]
MECLFPIVLSGFFQIRLLDVMDVILVALLLYAFYRIAKGSAAINIFLGLLAIYLVWKLVAALDMDLLGEILGAFISVGVIALIVVFQPEIRRFLIIIGSPRLLKDRRNMFLRLFHDEKSDNLDVDKIVKACMEMGTTSTGALIVCTKLNELESFAENGVIIDGILSAPLIQNIFFKNNPLHDGAVILTKNRIKAARCILPITKNRDFPPDYGLRHRAAAGITEISDAVAVIVSEQTGEIAYSVNGEIVTKVTPAQLKTFLEEEFN